MPTTSALFHTIFNVQATRYFEWQSRFFMFWAKVFHCFSQLTLSFFSKATLFFLFSGSQAARCSYPTPFCRRSGSPHGLSTDAHLSCLGHGLPPHTQTTSLAHRCSHMYRSKHVCIQFSLFAHYACIHLHRNSESCTQSKDSYLPYNKPLSIIHWLQNAKPKADVIVVMDPDCLIFKPLDIVRRLLLVCLLLNAHNVLPSIR